MQQSELALFTRDFQRALAPLEAGVAAALESLRAAGSTLELAFAADALAGSLAALSAELRALGERVERERATVFIFGPPKAGKSTLLDALAASRVSEVSILPGYPCLLRARHAAEEAANLQRFDGTMETLPDPAGLRLFLQRAHGELATSVREVRAAGEAFDPARHLQRAVRRVERAQPCEPLARAALELLECPPVHGPLFGSYAAMLIGEPDQARAAVFVVRAAQLADDAAFDGIEELLAAFERLIVVVNLDERSRELSRAGELVASLEREDPARLIAAFEELTSCEPLARALRSGKVPVLALDLLEAARARLHGAEEGATAGQRTRFVDLERELSGVLDGHESFRVLAHSALRRASALADEARELAGTPGLAELAPRRDAARAERTALATVQRALERLLQRERPVWESEELFDQLCARTATRAAVRARELAQELRSPLARAIEDWFADGTSLQELLDSRLEPRLAAARVEVARAAERGLREELRSASGGLSASVRSDLEEAHVALAPVLAACAERVHLALEPLALRALDVEAIPVRAKLGQRLLFKAAARVRHALLGSPEAPARPLPSADKAQRLGAEARTAMQHSAAERADAILADESRRLAGALGRALLTAFQDELHRHLAEERARLAEPVRAIEGRVNELDALAVAFGPLAQTCARTQAQLADLAERFEQSGTLVPAPRAPRPLAVPVPGGHEGAHAAE